MISKDDILRRHNMWETVLNQVHGFFHSRGYIHFRTPLLVKTPGMEPNLDPFVTRLSVSNPEIEDQDLGLITSPEYAMKKLFGAGFEKIYTITPVFRNAESIGPHNTPQFTMLEWYGPGDYKDCMDETEALVNLVMGWDGPWSRIKFGEADVDEHGDPKMAQELDRFFLYDYPPDQAALARLTPDGRHAERFEGFVHGIELCNGFSELTDPAEQRRRFESEQEERRAAGKHVFPIDQELLEALGMIKRPVYGNALGLDRLVMLRYGIGDIKDIQLFPHAFTK
ncbi:hypothetical protein IH979_02450 [Patescibacteria group bacterium]|nr:hypothetical protein [Patescibacteria group bacterium]